MTATGTSPPTADLPALEQELRLLARRNRWLALWAAGRLGLTAVEREAYARRIVQAEFEEPGDLDILRLVLGDLVAAGVETSEIELRAALADAERRARAELGA